MTVDEAKAIIAQLPSMTMKKRLKAVKGIVAAGFAVRHNSDFTQVSLGVPQDVMKFLLLEELSEEREPEVGDLIVSQDEADRLPNNVILLSEGTGEVYHRFSNPNGTTSYYVIGEGGSTRYIADTDFPLKIVWVGKS